MLNTEVVEKRLRSRFFAVSLSVDMNKVIVTVDRQKVSFFFKAKKYQIHKDNSWLDYSHFLVEGKSLEDIVVWVCEFNFSPKEIDTTFKGGSVVSKLDGNFGVQLCIKHIEKKIEFISKNEPTNHKLLTVLKTLNQELVQYL